MNETYINAAGPEAVKLWAKLIQLAHDRGVAARLVALEQRRLPGAGVREWVGEAIRRLLRDRGVIFVPDTLGL